MSDIEDSRKTTITTTSQGKEASESLSKNAGWFSTSIDAARTAFAYALANELEPSDATGYGHAHSGLTWGTTSFDPDEQVLALLNEFLPETREFTKAQCYTLIEKYINAGLLKMQTEKRLDTTPTCLI